MDSFDVRRENSIRQLDPLTHLKDEDTDISHWQIRKAAILNIELYPTDNAALAQHTLDEVVKKQQ